MCERKEGYYWVTRKRDIEWIVAEWVPDLNEWYECGSDECVHVSEIGSRIPTPEEDANET